MVQVPRCPSLCRFLRRIHWFLSAEGSGSQAVDPKRLVSTKSDNANGPQVHHHNPAKGFSNSSKHKVHCLIVTFYRLALTPCSCLSHLSYRKRCHSRWRSRILVTRELSIESALDLHHPFSRNLPSARKQLNSGIHFLKLSETFLNFLKLS